MKSQNLNYILFLIPLVVLGLFRLFGFDGLYGMDSYEYYRYSFELQNYILGGLKPEAFFWPQGYPILMAVLGLVLPMSLAGQLISFASLYGIFHYSFKIINLHFTQKGNTSIYLILSILLAPYFLRNGVQVMSDLLAVFCFFGAIFYALKFSLYQSWKALTLCGLFASYACFTRLGTAIPLVPFAIFTGFYFIKNFNIKYILSIIPILIIGFLYFHLNQTESGLGTHHFIDEWSISNFLETSFTSNEKHNLASFTYAYPNLVYYFGLYFYPGFFFLNSLFLIFALPQLKKVMTPFLWLVLFSLLLNTLFLSGVTFQGDRYLFPTYPLFIILIYPGFVYLTSKEMKYKKLIIGLLVIMQTGLSVKAIYPFWERNHLEKEIALELERFQGSTLYVFEMDLAMQQRGLNFDYKNLWKEEFKEFKKGSFVLFNPSKFESRYKGKTLMNNWIKIKAEYQLLEVNSFDNGWVLYELN